MQAKESTTRQLFIYSFALLLLLYAAASAEDDFTPVYNKSLHISRAAGEIKIDGRIDDAGWQGAAVADNFVENSPGDQIKPPVDTRGLLTYDDENFYIAVFCFDNPEDLRASYCERDRIGMDDNIGFFFETYGDASWAYILNVNPYGIQADAIWTSGYGEDSKYDLIWESAGQITDSGYQVEIAIPFSSLRFPDKEKQTWRVEFWRHHYRDTHYSISWSAYDRAESCWPCQWGTITGIENVKPGKGIEIMPAFVGYQSGEMVTGEYRADSTRPVTFENQDPDGELSLNAKYSISSDVTVEASFNPDFSQVEADAGQIDVNNTTALSFPEKRPFFQEGSDLFRTLFSVVHTRTINDPTFAAKMTARLGRTSLSYLGAHDENSPVVLPFEEGSSPALSAGKSYNNIFRVRQTFGENSQVGALVTDRQYEGGGSGSTFSLDGAIRFTKSLNFRMQSVASYTDEPDDTTITMMYPGDTTYLYDKFDGEHTAAFDGENFWGNAFIALLDYDARNAFFSGRVSQMSETFRTENGRERQNNRQQASIMAVYAFRFDEGIIQHIEPEIFIARIWNTGCKPKDEWVMLECDVQLREAQTKFYGSAMASGENYRGKQYDEIWNVYLGGHTFPSHMVGFGVSGNYGHRIARDDEVMGMETHFNGWLDLRPIKRMLMENSYTFVQSRHADSSRILFKGFLVRSRTNLQFTKELSLRLVVEYNDFSETWNFDPLLTYRLSPFSLLYVGTTYDYQRVYGLNADKNALVKDGDPSYDQVRLGARQFFMKLQYLFQL